MSSSQIHWPARPAVRAQPNLSEADVARQTRRLRRVSPSRRDLPVPAWVELSGLEAHMFTGEEGAVLCGRPVDSVMEGLARKPARSRHSRPCSRARHQARKTTSRCIRARQRAPACRSRTRRRRRRRVRRPRPTCRRELRSGCLPHCRGTPGKDPTHRSARRLRVGHADDGHAGAAAARSVKSGRRPGLLRAMVKRCSSAGNLLGPPADRGANRRDRVARRVARPSLGHSRSSGLRARSQPPPRGSSEAPARRPARQGARVCIAFVRRSSKASKALPCFDNRQERSDCGGAPHRQADE